MFPYYIFDIICITRSMKGILTIPFNSFDHLSLQAYHFMSCPRSYGTPSPHQMLQHHATPSIFPVVSMFSSTITSPPNTPRDAGYAFPFLNEKGNPPELTLWELRIRAPTNYAPRRLRRRRNLFFYAHATLHSNPFPILSRLHKDKLSLQMANEEQHLGIIFSLLLSH